MQKMYFGSAGLTYRPLKVSDFTDFDRIVSTNPSIKKFFRIESAATFWESLEEYECFPVGVFIGKPHNTPDSIHKLIGYINGYVYSNDELLVEFFLAENYYRYDYLEQLLSEYLNACRKLGFDSFRFEMEEGDTLSSFLTDFGASHYKEEDFVYSTNSENEGCADKTGSTEEKSDGDADSKDKAFSNRSESGRIFHVYKICY